MNCGGSFYIIDGFVALMWRERNTVCLWRDRRGVTRQMPPRDAIIWYTSQVRGVEISNGLENRSLDIPFIESQSTEQNTDSSAAERDVIFARERP